MNQKLGELLVEDGLLTNEQLNSALKIQQEEDSLLGRILVGQGYINNLKLHRAIAKKFGLEFVDLRKSQPHPSLLQVQDIPDYKKYDALPWRKETGKITIATSSITDALRDWAEKKYPKQAVEFVITSPFDILWVLQESFQDEDMEIANHKLSNKFPDFSAFKMFRKSPYLLAFIAALTVLAFVFPDSSTLTAFVAMNVLFFLTISFKNIAFVLGKSYKPKAYPEPKNLPVYTVLVPMYMEQKTLPQMIEAIEKLDYPKSKLDVKFVTEADDAMTVEAIKALNPPSYIEIIRTPFSLPRTKPKACNYAMQFARGEFVTIFDAEDYPHPNQLKQALARFEHDGEKLACVQGRLNYYNYNENFLTRWFALEYATWFDYVMRGLEKMKMPIPLGGTSNHVRRDVLDEVGGWDAFNVTEDADLGMRLAQFGYKTATIDTITMEEAPNHIVMWVKQRTRWIKGFMQTFIVHMRNPVKLVQTCGWPAFLTLTAFVGAAPIIFLSAPILLALSATTTLPEWLLGLSLFNFLYSGLSHIAYSAIAWRKSQVDGQRLFARNMIVPVLSFPFYCFLHIVAAYRALYQLIVKPSYWDKTSHGELRVEPVRFYTI